MDFNKEVKNEEDKQKKEEDKQKKEGELIKNKEEQTADNIIFNFVSSAFHNQGN